MWSHDQSLIYLAFKANFLREPFWFRLNNLGLALGIDLTFYTSLAKSVETKSQIVLGANSNVCRSCRGKTSTGGGGGGGFLPPNPSWIVLIFLSQRYYSSRYWYILDKSSRLILRGLENFKSVRVEGLLISTGEYGPFGKI